MTQFEFGGSQFPHKDALHDAIAKAWIGGNAAPTLEEAKTTLRSFASEAAIVEGRGGWNLKSKRDGVVGYDRKFLREALLRLIEDLEVEKANERLAETLGDDFHIAAGPSAERGYRIGRWEDHSETSFLYVGEVKSLALLDLWIAER